MQNNFPIDCVIMIHSTTILFNVRLFPRLNRSILKAILLNFSALYFSFVPHKMCRYTRKEISSSQNVFFNCYFSLYLHAVSFIYVQHSVASETMTTSNERKNLSSVSTLKWMLKKLQKQIIIIIFFFAFAFFPPFILVLYFS